MQIHRDRNWRLPGTNRRGNRELLVRGCGVSIWVIKILEINSDDGCTTF